MRKTLFTICLWSTLVASIHAQTSFKTLNYLYSISGSQTVSGQHNDQKDGTGASTYTELVNGITGKYPALYSADFLYNGDGQPRWDIIYEAERQWNAGAMVQFMWHTCPPTQNSVCSWGGGVLSTLTDVQWKDLTTDGGYLNGIWKSRIDEIAKYLQYLKDKNVEVLWRPLHEENQGSFWWGGRTGPEGTQKLYQLTHDYMTNVKGLTNLVWVWDVQDMSTNFSDYNPGANYYDIAALDVYSDGFTNSSYYNALTTTAGNKVVAIGECGTLPTVAQLQNQSRMSFFMNWSYLLQQDNSNQTIQTLYNDPRIITRDEMPGWGNVKVPVNLATAKPVTVSSTEVGSNIASNATDNSYSSRWSSLYADPQWISVDLGTNYNVNRVKIAWEAAYGKDYQIQVSSDAINWTNIKTITGNTTLTNDLTGLAGIGRYLRMYGTARGTTYGYSIYALEVYGTIAAIPESPYGGIALAIPGTIQAENYDLGGQGVAYNDITSGNIYGGLRTDDVDIETCTDTGGGYNIAGIQAGEWLNYIIKVATAGNYDLSVRVAAVSVGKTFHIEMDGVNISGTIVVPNTGGWQTWQNVTVPNVNLIAGQKVMRVVMDTDLFNLNYLSFTPSIAVIVPQTNVVGYFPTFRNFPDAINTIDLTKLTHLNIAFANPNSSGALVVGEVSNSAVTTVVNAAHTKNVKVLLCIGGGGAPGNYYHTAFSNSTNMTNFVNACVNYTTTYNLEGIDVDIEGDVLNGSQVTSSQYQSFVTQLGAALHAKNKIMTAAVADWFGGYVTNAAVAQFDFIGVMAYDEHIPGGSNQPGTVGDYQFAVDNYNYWHAKGVPGSKINIGVPFYGYGWGTYTGSQGGDSYASIVAKYPGAENSDMVGSGANAEYYNGIPTIKQKTAFAIQNGGGIMIWDLTMDATGGKSLLTAINQVVVANSNHVPSNLATGKTVTVASTEVGSNVTNNAVDGNYATRWSSLYSDPQWISIDLGANYNVNRVKLSWEAAYATAYQIQISSDNTNWSTLKSITGNITTTNDQTGLSGTGRYVRIYGTSRATVYGYSLYEIEVYGTTIESPYSGTAISLPGIIQAENYDLGGEGLAYHDTETANQGGVYRTDGVDIETTTDISGSYDVGYIADGEWLKYMVNVTTKGTYNFGFRTAGTITTSAIRVEVDGADVTGSIALPNTGGWQTWASTTSPNVVLSAGPHTIRLFVVTGGFNLNFVNVIPVIINQLPSINLTTSGTSFTAPAFVALSATAADVDGTVSKVEFYNGATLLATSTTSPYSFIWSNLAVGNYSVTAKATDNSNASTSSAAVTITVEAPVIVETPYGGKAWIIPGTIEAENYDNGGEGLSYHDIDTINQGGAYRKDGVDIEATTDAGGGYDVGYIANGNWLKYTVNVTASGIYNISFRTAGTSTSVISLLSDGVNVTGNVNLPNTGGWQTWVTTIVPTISLTAGQHIFEVLVSTASFNLNNITVTANQPLVISITSPANNASFIAPAPITITANASGINGALSKVDFYNGATLLGTDNTSPYSFIWNNVAAGTYSITVKATDNNNATIISETVVVIVNAVTTNTCSGLTPYKENSGYVPGSIVQNGGVIYQCKPFPYSGWCNGAAWAYGPGNGTAWTDAWMQTGTCSSARIGSISTSSDSYNTTVSNLLVPNPTTGIVSIAVNNSFSVQVFNSYGIEVMSIAEVTTNGSIDITGLSAGIYVVKIISGGDTITQKIIKQ